jgi:hypothetical protein
MDNELIDQGLTLMLAGMGTVFVFLTALVVAIEFKRRPPWRMLRTMRLRQLLPLLPNTGKNNNKIGRS